MISKWNGKNLIGPAIAGVVALGILTPLSMAFLEADKNKPSLPDPITLDTLKESTLISNDNGVSVAVLYSKNSPENGQAPVPVKNEEECVRLGLVLSYSSGESFGLACQNDIGEVVSSYAINDIDIPKVTRAVQTFSKNLTI